MRQLSGFDEETAGRLAELVLACVHREYPSKIAHVLNSAADALPPRELTPAFFGCYDWHSAVHGHWALARLASAFPSAPFSSRSRVVLAQSLTVSNLQAEALYMSAPGRGSFERPYGLAWLLTLAAELRAWPEMEAKKWADALDPLKRFALGRIEAWLPKLFRPVRSGEHSNTAFSLGLMLDYARSAQETEFEHLITERIFGFYANDRGCPIHYEPSGEDFLSPCLSEADAMRRVLPPSEFAQWLTSFLPDIPDHGSTGWLIPAVVSDVTDGKLAHLDGLNLSRAWMLKAIASALPAGDPRIGSLRAGQAEHARAGLEAITGENYEGAHWLGTFAVYLLSSPAESL